MLPIEKELKGGQLTQNAAGLDLHRDGRTLLYVASSSGGENATVWIYRLGDEQPMELLRSANVIMHPTFAPNGKFFAYATDESGAMEVVMQTFPRSNRVWPVSIGGGYEPRWGGDGREIFYLSPDRKLTSVAIGPDGPVEAPKLLFQTKTPAEINGYRRHYTVTRDGRRFLIKTLTGDATPTAITVVLNWTAAFRVEERPELTERIYQSRAPTPRAVFSYRSGA